MFTTLQVSASKSVETVQVEAQPKTNAIDYSQSSQSHVSLTMKFENNETSNNKI